MPSQVKPTLALFLLLVVPLHAQLLVDTVIGAKPQSGVSAHDVPLSQLGGVAYDAAGNLVFCDQGLNLIRRIRPDGVIETLAGSGLAGFSGDGAAALNAALNQPALPRFDGKGNLYFADLSNFRIRRVDASGIITTIGGTGVAFQTGMDPEGPALSRSLGPIADMAVDPAGNVYFTFANNTDLIRRITPAGRLEIFAGIPHPECVYCSDGDNGPARAARIGATHLAADTKGNLFFSELAPPSDTSFATHIRRIAGDGTITRFAGYGPANGDTENDDGPPALDVYIYAISAMTADATGNLYFVQAPKPSSKAGQRIRRVDTFGFIRTLAGGGPGATTLDGPALEISVLPLAIAVDARANIAFTETLPAASPLTGSIVRRVTAQAAVQTLAGDVPAIAPSHIKPAEAWLVNPTSVAFNRAGELFIAESGACLIRKIGLDGFFVTVAGTGYCGKSLPGLPAATEDLAPPAGLLADNQGRIYMLDRAGNYYSVAASGAVSPVTELPPSVGPGKLAFDAKGRTYIMSPNSLLRVSPSGNQETIVAKPPQFGLPTNGPTSLGAIGVDPAGTVYFSGTYPAASTDYIFRVNDDASITQVYGSDATPLHLGSVTSLALDSRGNVWLGNTFVNSFGTFTLGRPDPGFSGDGGLAQSARFDAAPMAFAPNGDLYFADGKRIRKVTGAPPNPPAITGGGIVNAVSYASAAIAPGELVTIFGSGFGATELITNTLENNRLPTVLGRTKVLFDGRPGAIVAMTSTQINVFVPYSVVPGKSAAVIVQTDSAVSVPVIIPVVAAVPGLATADQTGSGPGAILNQDSSFNTAANPAARGSLVTLFGTGEGFVSPQLISGDLSISTPLSAPVGPVTVSIGDAPAEVSFAGAAPMLPVGVLQINVKIPTGISPGPAAIKVSIGGIATSKVVTVAVK